MGSIELVKQDLETLKICFANYETINESIEEHFDNDNPDHVDIFEDAHAHSKKVSADVFEAAKAAQNYLNEPNADVASSPSKNATLEQVEKIIHTLNPVKNMETLIKSINLPQQKDMKFNGEPSEYH